MSGASAFTFYLSTYQLLEDLGELRRIKSELDRLLREKPADGQHSLGKSWGHSGVDGVLKQTASYTGVTTDRFLHRYDH